MYLLNHTFFVDAALGDAWKSFTVSEYVPALRSAGFGKVTLSRVLDEHACDHFTWSLLVELETMEDYATVTGEIFGAFAGRLRECFDSEVLWQLTLMRKDDSVG